MSSFNKTKVYVSPLTPNVTSDHLYEIFSHFGKVSDVELKSYEKARDCMYYKGIISFESYEDANNSVSSLNKGEIDGVIVSVSLRDY